MSTIGGTKSSVYGTMSIASGTMSIVSGAMSTVSGTMSPSYREAIQTPEIVKLQNDKDRINQKYVIL